MTAHQRQVSTQSLIRVLGPINLSEIAIQYLWSWLGWELKGLEEGRMLRSDLPEAGSAKMKEDKKTYCHQCGRQKTEFLNHS